MKNLRALMTRSTVANSLAAAGGSSFVTAAFMWCPIAGFCVLGVALIAAGWGVSE